jgi:hypothetical protein
MTPETWEFLKIAGPLLSSTIGAAAGAVGGPWFKEWIQNRQVGKTQQQTRWSPLLRAALDFKERLIELRAKYLQRPLPRAWSRKPDVPSEAGDFCELYTLAVDPEPIDDWYKQKGDPDTRRKDGDAVQRVHMRIHELNCASTTLYMTAKYLAFAQRVRKELEERTLLWPKSAAARRRLADLLDAVRTEFHGSSKDHPGAGVIKELQDSIGETMWNSNGTVMSEFEFRKELLKTPGWEQFLELLRFYVNFHLKTGEQAEVVKTIRALEELCLELRKVCT